MRCVLYSMEHGKIEMNNISGAKIYGSEIAEIHIFSNHQPIIGDIKEKFEIFHFQEEDEVYEVNLGFFEFRDDKLTIIANFKNSK